MKKFLTNFKAEKFFCIFTFCDKAQLSEEQIEGKLQSFEKYADVMCPRNHVIKFKNTAESLYPLIDKI